MQDIQKIKQYIYSPATSKHIRIHLPDFKDYFTMTSLPACDYVLIPNVWMDTEDNSEIEEIARYAEAVRKELLVFWITDSDSPIALRNCITFKTSILKSKQLSTEHAYPALFDDPLEIYF